MRTAAAAVARAFLDAMEARDLDRAKSLLSPDFQAIYPGDRRFTALEDLIASGGKRYRAVRKTYEHAFQIPSDERGIETVVFSGTLSGQWVDDESFSGIRFTDRFRVRDGLIVEQQVWNDIGEALLVRAGTA